MTTDLNKEIANAARFPLAILDREVVDYIGGAVAELLDRMADDVAGDYGQDDLDHGKAMWQALITARSNVARDEGTWAPCPYCTYLANFGLDSSGITREADCTTCGRHLRLSWSEKSMSVKATLPLDTARAA